MNVHFHFFEAPYCSLCGEKGMLTREHKIKRSILSKIFPKEQLHIGPVNEPVSEGRIIQSPRSTYLKFNSKICEACNTVRTQSGDRQFDIFISKAIHFYEAGVDPSLIYHSIGLAPGTKEHRDLFRYFAKVLCCFMAEVGSPVPRRLSEFAIGRTDTTNIRIEIVEDQEYKKILKAFVKVSYAAHAGLSVIGNKTTLNVERFMSGCSFGPINIIFDFRLSPEEQQEFRNEYPGYFSRVLSIAGAQAE